MANKLDPMDLKQIITLHSDGISNRKIAYLLSISRNTVNDYISRFRASQWSLEELRDMDNQGLEERFPILTTIDNARFDELMRFFEKVNQARNHPGFTFQFHYQEYKAQADKPPYPVARLCRVTTMFQGILPKFIPSTHN